MLGALLGWSRSSVEAADDEPPSSPQEVPTEEDQKEAVRILETAFRKALAVTKEEPQEQDHPRLYLSLAREPTGWAPVRFVAYRQAARRFSSRVEVHRMLETVNEWSSQFAIDALEVKWELLQRAASRRSRSEEVVVRAKRLVSGALRLAADAIRAGDLTAARRTLEMAGGVADSARFDEHGPVTMAVSRLIADRREEVSRARSRYSLEREEELRQRLEERPADPEVNGQLGALLCFGRADWSAGLPFLENGEDESLRQVATMDRGHPAVGLRRRELGNRWLGEAERLEKDALALRNVEARALQWYVQSLPELRSEDRGPVRLRIRGVSTFQRSYWTTLCDATLWLPLDEGAKDVSRSLTFDASGARNDAKVLGSSMVIGHRGEAEQFDGRIAHLVGRDAARGFPLEDAPRTIAAWIRVRGRVERWLPVLSYGEHSPSRDYAYCCLCLDASNNAPTLIIGRNFVVSQAGELNDGSWHHVAAVYEGPDTDRVSIYLDGIEIHSERTGRRVDTQLGAGRWMVGRGARGYFQGGIDDVLLFSRALTPEEVAIVHAGQPGK